MSDTPELSTRDVFAQVDRRLTRLEDDLREFRQEVGNRFARMEAKIDSQFRWQVGISLGLWLSVMSTILLK
jgi:hypothetical protein